jgi:hypothetical protein
MLWQQVYAIATDMCSMARNNWHVFDSKHVFGWMYKEE